MRERVPAGRRASRAHPDTPAVRLLSAGLAIAVAIGVVGLLLVAVRPGLTPDRVLATVQADVRERIGRIVGNLQEAGEVLAHSERVRVGLTEPALAGDLFDALERTAAERRVTAITAFGADGTARAWWGRPSELLRDRITGPAERIVVAGPAGLRLVQLTPVHAPDPAEAGGRRIGTLAVEQLVAVAPAVRLADDEAYRFETRAAEVSVRPVMAGWPADGGFLRFTVPAPTGEPLLEGIISPAEVEAARRDSLVLVGALMLATMAVLVLLLAGAPLDRRAVVRHRSGYVQDTLLVILALAGGAVLLWIASRPGLGGGSLFSSDVYASPTLPFLLRSPADLLLGGLVALALAGLAADAVWRARLAARSRRRSPLATRGSAASFAACHLGAGAAALALLAAGAWLAADVVQGARLDLLNLALPPFQAGRLAVLFGLLFVQVALVWAAVLALLSAFGPWRVSRSGAAPLSLAAALWMTPWILVAASGARLPLGALLAALAVCALGAMLARRARARYRHAAQSARLAGLLLMLVVPALLLYPLVLHHAERQRRELVETHYARQAAEHPQALQAHLAQALAQIDAIPGLAAQAAVIEGPEAFDPHADTAFEIWRRTDLAAHRLTSAVEVYGRDATLVSRFALGFPEYEPAAQTWVGTSCEWEVFGEAAPFGAQERRMLHAERALCLEAADGGQLVVGGLIVHVMLDYRALPFISPRSPYAEVFRPGDGGWRPAASDVELVIYGWGRSPIFTSGEGAWQIGDALFDRLYRSRAPFWTTLVRGDARQHVYFVNNRAGIYAVGYQALGVFDHFVRLAELTTLAGLGFALVVAGGALFSRLARRQPSLRRTLVREIRTSFYRKLSVAFVLAAVVPAVVLAFLIRAYFVTQLRAGAEADAVRTVAVAQRVIEESAALEQRGEPLLTPFVDDVMVGISQIINQNVNLFEGSQLVATSERDLFASGFVPTRTPERVYRALVLERRSSFVTEEQLGGQAYLLAAAPIRTDGRETIVTVPLAPRQLEIEREVAELDRAVHLAAVFFVLAGSIIGFSMAERIGDPVTRLTRATRRIARGDFDAHVLARSADELQRLVEAFNRMAEDLKAQRAQLERSNRLEAWAEMARQVAHEIKNPLTPIQLSAEHLERVHADRGRPLGPVFESCLASILQQVRLLRRIASEFSSFASEPIARPAPVPVADLVEEVIGPYRAGLADRIALRVEVPDGLPLVFVDRSLLTRALANVVENALHAMPGRGEMALRAAPADGRVRLTVEDTGAGMDEEALARIFEPYFSTKSTGTGLGMPIARRNVELCGGTIEVASARGRGTAVRIGLPVEPAVG